eukprot:4545245-Pleurochrysis_carterae.AAC.6
MLARLALFVWASLLPRLLRPALLSAHGHAPSICVSSCGRPFASSDRVGGRGRGGRAEPRAEQDRRRQEGPAAARAKEGRLEGQEGARTHAPACEHVRTRVKPCAPV